MNKTENRITFKIKDGYNLELLTPETMKLLGSIENKKRPNTPKKSTTDAIKTVSKRAIQKTAEATGDLIGNKIADKITSVSKKTQNNESEVPKKDAYLQKKDNKLLMN